MILKLSQSANKLNYITKHVIELLIVQPNIEKPLTWDQTFFLILEADSWQLSDVNFTIFDFFKWFCHMIILWRHFLWSMVMLLLQKEIKASISLTNYSLSSQSIGKVLFELKLAHTKIAFFISKKLQKLTKRLIKYQLFKKIFSSRTIFNESFQWWKFSPIKKMFFFQRRDSVGRNGGRRDEPALYFCADTPASGLSCNLIVDSSRHPIPCAPTRGDKTDQKTGRNGRMDCVGRKEEHTRCAGWLGPRQLVADFFLSHISRWLSGRAE